MRQDVTQDTKSIAWVHIVPLAKFHCSFLDFAVDAIAMEAIMVIGDC